MGGAHMLYILYQLYQNAMAKQQQQQLQIQKQRHALPLWLLALIPVYARL